MSVYVDQTRRIARGRGEGEWCHMMADTPEELERMARKLGLEPAYRHDDHYELTPTQRLEAVKAGAKEVDTLFLVRLRWSKR